MQPTARGMMTTTSSPPSNTYWQPPPRAHTPTSKPWNRGKPTTPCNPAPYPPQPARTSTRNTSSKKPTAPPRTPPPPPPNDIYATLPSTLAGPMDARQYYQCVLREIPANHATLQGGRQAKESDNNRGLKDDLLWEDTWKGTMDTFFEAAATTYPRPAGDTRHSLHALLAFHSWIHHHRITLHPLDDNPHRWATEDDATTAITIQQDPENPAGYHHTWNDPAPTPPASPTLQDVFVTISAELQEAKAPQSPGEEMPQAPPRPTAQKRPHQEPLAHPITKKKLTPQHRTTPHRNGFQNLPRDWAVHNGTLRWDQNTPGLQAIRLHSITEPINAWALPADRDQVLLTFHADAAITPAEGDPRTAAPAHAIHIPRQTSSAPMTVRPGPTPWQAIVITYRAPNDHTRTWQQRSFQGFQNGTAGDSK